MGYILQALQENSSTVSNLKSYLLAALFNAPATYPYHSAAKSAPPTSNPKRSRQPHHEAMAGTHEQEAVAEIRKYLAESRRTLEEVMQGK